MNTSELNPNDEGNPISGQWDLEQSNMDTEQASVDVAENTNDRGSFPALPAGTKKLVLSPADLKSYQMTSDPRGLALIIGKKKHAFIKYD